MGQDKTSSFKTLLVALAAFLWLGLLAGGYFWAHQPFTMVVVTAVTTTILTILIWLTLAWLSTNLGLMLLARLRLNEADALAQLVLAVGLGLGLLSILVALLGFAGLLRPWAAWILVVALAVLTWRRWRQPGQLLRRVGWPRPQNNLHRIILVFAVVSLPLVAIMALAPVTAWDSLTYHLVGPKLYIEAGRFVHSRDIPQLGFPLLGQMQFTLGMLLVGDGAAALFHFGYGLLALALVVQLARRLFSDAVAWYATAVLLSVPLFWELMAWPYVDVTLLFYTTAVFYTFIRWRQTRQTSWLVALGMMIGFSGGLKYTAVAIPAAVTVGLMWDVRRDGVTAVLRRLLLVGAVALVLILPWLLENTLTTGNPIYPFFLSKAAYWDDWRAWWYNRPGTGVLATSPISLLLAPVEASILDATLALDTFDGTIGPFVLGSLFLLPLVWGALTPSNKRWSGWLLLFAAAAYGLWLWGIARSALLLQVRLLLPAFGLFALLGGLVLEGTQRWKLPQLAADWLVRMIVGLTLILLLVTQLLAFWQINPLPVVVGLESQANYLRRTLGVYDEVITAVNQLPPDAHVQFLWEARSYRCQVFCQPDPILDTWLHLTQAQGYDAAQIAQVWQAAGVTHVLMFDAGRQFIVEAGFDPITEADLAVWDEFRRNYLHPLQTWPDDYTLYQFEP